MDQDLAQHGIDIEVTVQGARYGTHPPAIQAMLFPFQKPPLTPAVRPADSAPPLLVDFALDSLRFPAASSPEEERIAKSPEGQDIRVASGTVSLDVVVLGALRLPPFASACSWRGPFR